MLIKNSAQPTPNLFNKYLHIKRKALNPSVIKCGRARRFVTCFNKSLWNSGAVSCNALRIISYAKECKHICKTQDTTLLDASYVKKLNEHTNLNDLFLDYHSISHIAQDGTTVGRLKGVIFSSSMSLGIFMWLLTPSQIAVIEFARHQVLVSTYVRHGTTGTAAAKPAGKGR